MLTAFRDPTVPTKPHEKSMLKILDGVLSQEPRCCFQQSVSVCFELSDKRQIAQLRCGQFSMVTNGVV